MLSEENDWTDVFAAGGADRQADRFLTAWNTVNSFKCVKMRIPTPIVLLVYKPEGTGEEPIQYLSS